MSNNPRQPEIAALGEAYNHARKAYGLTSALLIAWELIGVELEASPIESVKLTLKSPQAAPYVLIVLIIYFGFRMTIEWYQNDIRRRRLPASRIDFAVAHAIAIVSLALYGYQTLSKVQLANIIAPSHFIFFLTGGIAVLTLHWAITQRNHILNWKEDPWLSFFTLFMALFSLFFLGAVLYVAGTERDLNVLLAAASGLLIGLTLIALQHITTRIMNRFL